MSLKFHIGLVQFSFSFFAILLNLLIFLPVFHLAFVSRKSTIYIIAFFNILSDLFQLTFTCFHLSASVMADRYVLSSGPLDLRSLVLGGYFINAWFMECVIQVVMAANRFAVITLKNKTLFTFTTTILLFIIIICITTFSAICMQYLFPCCRFITDHNVMSYMQVEVKGLYNYSNALLLFYNVSCTITSTLCYVFVWYSIRKNNKLAPANVAANRSNQDIKYLIQFVFISIFYIFTWVLFELLPHLVPADQPEWFAVVPVLLSCNCSSNSIIFLKTNPEVQKRLPIAWLRRKLVKVQASYASSLANPPVNPAN